MKLQESEFPTRASEGGGGGLPSPIRKPVRDEFDALADPHRRELLRMLCESDCSVNELAARLPISRPAVSRHLKLLQDAGLVAEKHSGTRHIFRLRPEGARAVQEYLERVWGATRSERPLAEASRVETEPGALTP